MSKSSANVDQDAKVPDLQLQFLSAERFAELLDISVRTLWRLRSAGKIPQPVRIGGNIRWNAAEIWAWIEAGCPGSSQNVVQRKR